MKKNFYRVVGICFKARDMESSNMHRTINFNPLLRMDPKLLLSFSFFPPNIVNLSGKKSVNLKIKNDWPNDNFKDPCGEVG